jgi:ribosome biogenesis ATPase
VIFFDEFDSLCPKRSDSGENSSQRVVNQLLTEMDGVEDRKGVFLMAATNRPDIIDPAVLRPGRLDKVLYVGLPELKDRTEILKALTKNGKKPEIAEDVDFDEISALTQGYTGADLAGMVRQASLQTLKESIEGVDVSGNLKVHRNHFIEVIKKIKPSVTPEVR